MRNEIEQAALKRLTDRIGAIRSSAVQKDTAGLLTNPALSAACLEGSYRQLAGKWECTATLSILLEYKHAKGEAARKAGANPLVECIVQMLIDQKLGLKISMLKPLRDREVTDETAYDEGKYQHLMQFSTSYMIEKPEEEEIEELLGIAVDCLLQPGDDQPDAADELETA